MLNPQMIFEDASSFWVTRKMLVQCTRRVINVWFDFQESRKIWWKCSYTICCYCYIMRGVRNIYITEKSYVHVPPARIINMYLNCRVCYRATWSYEMDYCFVVCISSRSVPVSLCRYFRATFIVCFSNLWSFFYWR